MIRYLVSAIFAALTLFATLYGLSKAIGPDAPGELFLIRHLDLLTPSHSGDPPAEP